MGKGFESLEMKKNLLFDVAGLTRTAADTVQLNTWDVVRLLIQLQPQHLFVNHSNI